MFNPNAADNEQQPTGESTRSILNRDLPKLAQRQREALDTPVTEIEMRETITKAPANKAAGPDGIRAELFHLHTDTWAKILTPIVNDAMTGKPLPNLFRTAIVILLYKKGQPTEPANYRPIALLNVIAKLLSAIHNTRLRDFLPDIIPQTQTGFVPRRSITENILIIRDSLHWAKKHCPSALVLCLDFAKAYDRVNWEFMITTLRKLGFGPKWIALIQNIYSNRSAKLSINGKLTETFQISRGVLQGDLLSPSLFILQATPLYRMIEELRSSCAILLLGSTTTPAGVYYADDSNLLARSPHHASILYNAAHQFCIASGARLNIDKCIAVPAGPAPLTLPNGIRILQPGETTTILGVPFGPTITREQQTSKVFNKMLTRCAQWKLIGRTIKGRVTIARTIIASTAWYILSAIETSCAEAKRMQRIVEKFIHKNEDISDNSDKVKSNFSSKWLYRAKSKEGCGLTPIITTITCRKAGINRNLLTKHDNSLWASVMWNMCSEAPQGWANETSDVRFWKVSGGKLGLQATSSAWIPQL